MIYKENAFYNFFFLTLYQVPPSGETEALWEGGHPGTCRFPPEIPQLDHQQAGEHRQQVHRGDPQQLVLLPPEPLLAGQTDVQHPDESQESGG